MIPYRDENETLRPAIVTIAIIALNALAWVLLQGAGSALPLAKSVCNLGLIAGEITGRVQAGTQFPIGEGLVCIVDPGRHIGNIFTSMFLHGSWMHIIGNMWFLWIFGNNVEDSMGHVRFIFFYLISGVAAAALQIAVTPGSVAPMVGASGAISGVMGAYLVLYPRVRVFTLVPLGFFLTTIALPAWAMLIYWIGLQFLSGISAIGSKEVGGVAFWAHLGGFLAGVALIKLFVNPEYVREHAARQWQPRRMGWRG